MDAPKTHGKPGDNSAAPATEPRLASVTFMPGISVMVGGKWSALTFWSRQKHVDEVKDEGSRIHCEELKNGDVRITTADGRTRKVTPWAVAYCTYEPHRAAK